MKENQTSGDEARSPSDAETIENETTAKNDSVLNGTGIVVERGELEPEEGKTLLEEDEELSNPSLSADELLQEGKAALKSGDVELAVEKFSEAVEKKYEELGEAHAEGHPSLGQFYLEYGNALLKNAENSNNLFRIQDVEPSKETKVEEPATDEEADEGVKEADETGSDVSSEDVSDEQLAWEVLELGRICYAKKLSELEASGEPSEEEKSRVVEDAAFIHLRLGDLLIVEEKFLEAAEEFKASLNLLTKFEMPYTSLISSTIALAQAYLFGGKVSDSLATFKEALALLTQQMGGINGATISEERLEDFKATQEDLAIQIAEIERNLKNSASSSSSGSSSSSSSDTENRISSGFRQPETPFAPSVLKAVSGETVLGQVQGKKAKAKAAQGDAAQQLVVTSPISAEERRKRPRADETTDSVDETKNSNSEQCNRLNAELNGEVPNKEMS